MKKLHAWILVVLLLVVCCGGMVLALEEVPAAADVEAPVIETQPAPEYRVNRGDNLQFQIEASVTDGGTLSYQWYRTDVNVATNAAEIVGAVSSVYQVPTETLGMRYYYCAVTNTKEELPGENQTVTVTSLFKVTVEEDGETVQQHYGVVLLYDWDDTLIGTARIRRSATDEEIAAQIDATAQTLMAPADRRDGYGYYAGTEGEPGEMYPLTYKKAYRFEGIWLSKESEAFCCYRDDNIDYANEPEHHGRLADYAQEDYPDYAELRERGQLSVKAAYKAEANINTGVIGGGVFYTQTGISYDRYGAAAKTTGQYSVKITFVRENEMGIGVTRRRSPVLRLLITPDGEGAKSFCEMIRLDGRDRTEVELVLPKGFKQVEYSVVDLYPSENWTAATDLSNKETLVNYEGIQGDDGFVRRGTIGYINRQALAVLNGEPNNWSAVNLIAMHDAGLKQNGEMFTAATTNSIAKPAILDALTKNGGKPLSFEELQTAIDSYNP